MNYEKYRRMCDEENVKPVVYKLTKEIAFSDAIPDKRLNLSQIGLLAILLAYFTPEMEIKAEQFKKYTYEDENAAAENLSVLEKCGYVLRVE